MATPSRPIQSCLQCRKRKIKCNRSYPCAPCILRGERDACREVDKSHDSSSKTTGEIIEDLLHRVSTLEAVVLKNSGAPGSARAEPSYLPSPSLSPPADQPESGSSIIRSSFGKNTTDEDVAMMLEDFAMGHRVNQTRATQDLDAVPYFDNHSPKLSPHGIHHLGVPDKHPLALLIDPGMNIMNRLLVSMIPEAQSQALIQFYFNKLESWSSKILHKPTFIAESQVLLTSIISRNVSAIRIGFLAVYYMVLCLALHLIEPVIREQLGMSFAAASELARRMYSAAQACLYYDEFIGAHSLEHLQSIILMGLYQQNLDQSDAHWALMGTAIKIAQNLGLSQLGTEGDGRQYSAAWRSSLVKREVARRVWWTLIWDDWSNAAAHNGTYAIHPSQNHTGFPANINDCDLVDGQPFIPKPPHTYTEMTFSLCRLRFVELYRQIVDNMQAPTGYGFVVDIDRKISNTILELPSYFRGPEPAAKGFELTLALIMGETRRLRLHRPFLFRGYKDRKYVDSRVQCVNSATAILDYLKSDAEQSALLLKWWLVLFYGFAAAVVLFIDLCHHKADERPDLEIRRLQLREALDMFKTAEHVSAVSQNAIALLEGLLAVEPGMPSKPSRKRGATDDEPFERIVKRMIIDASRNLTVPSSHSPHSSRSSPSVQSPVGIPPLSSGPVDFAVQSPSGNDLFVSGALFRDEGVFSGPQFDDRTMAQLSQLLYNDPYGFLDIPIGYES